MDSCWQSWRGPVFFASSLVLLFFAVSTSLHSTHNSPQPNISQLSLDASKALRRAGFNAMATLVSVSHQYFFTSPNTTIFAPKDAVLANISLSPLRIRYFLQYHGSPLRYSMNDLLHKPRGSCLPSLLPGKNIAITKNVPKKRRIEINGVPITHPDVFLGDRLAIHGVPGSFTPLRFHDSFWGLIQPPTCDSHSNVVSNLGKSEDPIDWSQVVKLLSSKGYVAFAISLQTLISAILDDERNFPYATIFAPRDFVFVSSALPTIQKVVRLHILPRRYTYAELKALPGKSSLKTLLLDKDLEVKTSIKRGNATNILTVNEMEIEAPNIITSNKFTIHGISRAFEMPELSCPSR